MGKLFKVREWLTLEAAARHLTSVCEEEVTVADILQMVIEEKLTLSVNLVNHAKAKLGKVVRLQEAKTKDVPSPIDGTMMRYVGSLFLNKGQPITWETPVVEFDDEISTIDGVWDLAMVGSERLDIEHLFQQLTGGPDIELVYLDGSFLRKPDGTWAGLQENMLRNRSTNKKDAYFPAPGLPDDSSFVVRKEALLDFEQLLLDAHGQTPAPPDEKPLETKERNSLLAIIGLLADQCSLDLHTPSKTAQVIESAANLKGIKLASRTIAEHLKKVPQAMEHLSR